VGTDVESSAEAIRLAGLDGSPVELWATVGLHPHEASSGTRGLRELLDSPGAERVVAIGECGLDYFYEHSPREAQLEALRDQVRLASERDLALVLHVRAAFEDLFEVLGDEGVPDRTIVHCFTGGPEEARRCVAAGMVVSISGIVTFKNAAVLREAVDEVPLDRLLVETDSPFLAPVPHRGQANEPAYVVVVGEAVAELLGRDPGVVRQVTSENASRVFALE
jgi:TatD DNase family protein